MNDNYYTLPRDYFVDLFEKIIGALKKDGNVCVSALIGGGGKTFFNYFLEKLKVNSAFQNIYIYDAETETEDLVRFIKRHLDSPKKTLFIVRYFELLKNKKEVLEKLESVKRLHPGTLTYLVFSDHTLLTDPEQYVAITTAFFLERFYIAPYDFDQSFQMIKLNCEFYGWNVSPKLYRRIYELSGGIPRLNKYIAKVIAETPDKQVNLKKIQENPNISFQMDFLNKIVLSYRKVQLEAIGLLDNKSEIKSLLLRDYFERYQNDVLKNMLPALSSFERKFLTFLYERKGEVVDLDTIGDLFEMSGHEFSPWATYKLISRIRPKIKKFFTLESVKGQGYLLNQLQ